MSPHSSVGLVSTCRTTPHAQCQPDDGSSPLPQPYTLHTTLDSCEPRRSNALLTQVTHIRSTPITSAPER